MNDNFFVLYLGLAYLIIGITVLLVGKLFEWLEKVDKIKNDMKIKEAKG